MRIPFIGSTYTLRSLRADCQNCINYYPENIESGTGANSERAVLLQVPGLRRLATIGTGPIRGVYTTSTGILAVVSGNSLYAVASDWSSTFIGSLSTSAGLVDMVDNGLQLCIVDGPYGYIASLVTGTFERITAAGFYGSNRVAFQDSYFICNNPGTGQFYISGLNDGLSWDPLDFGVAEGLPDAVVGVVVNQRQLWVAGAKSMEVYWNSGDTFAFSRIDGSFQEFGCAAAFTLQKVAGTVMWLTNTGHVVVANGYKPEPVSNFAVELAIAESGDTSSASAFSYYQDGHYFYCLHLPGASTTWCYDLKTQQWHERAELVNGVFAPSRVRTFAEAYGELVVGDGTDGRIYALDINTFDNDGDILVRERTAPHITNDLHRLSVYKFQLDIDGGQGLITGQGSNPQVMLRVSKDGGYTFGNEKWATAGGIGAFRTRAIYRQLGQARDWVFRVRITDPVKANLLGADIDALPAGS